MGTSPGFVHLDVRSFFSLKDGAFSPEALARRAAGLGMPAVALTDRDGLYGTARFVDACQKAGVKPILGATLTVSDPRSAAGTVATQVILLAQDDRGYANLSRLITDAHMTGERGDPSLASEQICAHTHGLLCLLGPSSLPGSLAVDGRFDAARHAIDPFREAFGERLFVAVQHRLEPTSATEVRMLLRLAEWIGAKAVATNPVRYLVQGDAFLADALECMREIVPVAQHHVSRVNAEGFLKPAGELRALFAERPDLCDRTIELAESCTFDVGLRTVHFPDFPTPRGRSAASVLAERCWRGMDGRAMEATHEVKDRLDLELALIQRMGYAAYFLTVADIVADIKAMGIRCACRGSAAGSLVCYLTGISDVDAVRHDLVFERFLNPLRDELPDIDVDVESARREDVYDMILSRYGRDRCACVTMVDTYRARSSIREVGKALGYPEVEVDTVAKAFPHIGAQDIRKAIEILPELAGSNLNAGQLELLFRVAERLEGFPRHLALHPSGIVLSDDDLVNRVPLERSFQGYRMIQADKDDVEVLGYLKLDVLGVRMLSSMRHALDEIARTEALKVDLDEIPKDDEPTFELIRASDTLGRHLDDDGQGPSLREDFLKRARDRAGPGDLAARTWDDVAQFASCGFCKAHAAAFAFSTSQSAYLKAHWPAHFLAGVLTHDPGMYPRRLILEDAREHGIEILPLDVNASEPDYVAERVGAGYGIRLALKDVHGMSDAEVRSIQEARAERPFRDVADFLRRATVSRPVVEALAHAGAFDALPAGTRRVCLYGAMVTDPQREGDQLALDLWSASSQATEPRFSLPEYSDAERVRAELEVLGLDASRHLVSFFEPLLADLGVTRARDLHKERGDAIDRKSTRLNSSHRTIS